MLNSGIDLKASRLFITLILLTLLSNLVIVYFLPFAAIIKTGLGVVILFYSLWALRRYGFLTSPHSILGLKQLNDDIWQLRYPEHSVLGSLTGDSTVTAFLTVLRFKIPGKRFKQACVVLRDSLDTEEYRRFLVELKNR
jgi:hypothetical protein